MAEIDEIIKQIEKDIECSTGYEYLYNKGRLNFAVYVKEHHGGVFPERSKSTDDVYNDIFTKLDRQIKEDEKQ